MTEEERRSRPDDNPPDPRREPPPPPPPTREPVTKQYDEADRHPVPAEDLQAPEDDE